MVTQRSLKRNRSSAAVDADLREGITAWSKRQTQWRQAFTMARAAPDVAVITSQALPANICMVGAGNMGGAMLRGWLASGSVAPERTSACTRNQDRACEWEDAGLGEVWPCTIRKIRTLSVVAQIDLVANVCACAFWSIVALLPMLVSLDPFQQIHQICIHSKYPSNHLERSVNPAGV